MKNDLNSVLIEGNLVSDPELAYKPNGTPVAKLRIASKRCYKTEDEYGQEISLFEIIVYDRKGEVCQEKLRKGRGVRVVGRLKQERWQEADGSDREKIIIVAEHVEFKPKREEPINLDRAEATPA